MTKIEIPLSKTKLIIGTTGSFIFLVLGYYMLTTIDVKQSIIYSIFIKTFGIAGIIFFGTTGVYGLKKMFDKKFGLTIDENGITDNSNMSSIGLIKWKDITEIKIKQVRSTPCFLIFTNDNDKYLEKASRFKRRLMNGNMKMYGTPLSITANTLNYNFDELEKLLNEKFKEQQNKMPNR
jgi:hypothetical protein